MASVKKARKGHHKMKGHHIVRRKLSHIDIALTRDVSYHGKTAGFEDIEIIPRALPELDYHKINSSVSFFGKNLQAPFIIDAITGGYDGATKINKSLAAAAEKAGIAFALGSQRAMIEHPELKDTYYVRDVAPSIPIIGNIGAVNLKERGMAERVEAALKDIDANALAIHLNPLQESIQPEGDKNFEGCLAAIAETCRKVDVPVIVKEVGVGISGDVARQLDKVGVAAINIAGAGGTSWSRIELLRGEGGLERFSDTGLSTVIALIDALKSTSKPIIVSGGVRSGVDAGKGLALGGSYAAAALPFLQAWKKGNVYETIEQWKKELHVFMFMAGAKDIGQLRESKPLIIGDTADFLWAWGERGKWLK